MQDESGWTSLIVIDLGDDTFAEEMKTDLGKDVVMAEAVLILYRFNPFEYVVFDGAIVDVIILAVGR